MYCTLKLLLGLSKRMEVIQSSNFVAIVKSTHFQLFDALRPHLYDMVLKIKFEKVYINCLGQCSKFEP